jgi:hypothetical protein
MDENKTGTTYGKQMLYRRLDSLWTPTGQAMTKVIRRKKYVTE